MNCEKCGLPKDLCVCAEIEKENTRVAVGVGRRDGALVKPPIDQITNTLKLLDEIEKAELQNYDTAKAMPKDNPMRNELMSHAWGRIKLARLVRKRLTQ